jgi:hypothetical protein
LISVVAEFLLAVLIVRRYRWTVSSVFYDKRSECKREIETHYSVAVSGRIRDNRRKLGLRGARYHQYLIYAKFGRPLPRGDIKVRFERENVVPASKLDSKISVEGRSMQYKGPQWTATALPSEQIPFWASKNERVSAAMRKDAEEREKHGKKIRALKKKLMKNV